MKRARTNILSDAALALSSGTFIVDCDSLLTSVAVKREIFQFCFRQNLGIGFLSALRTEKKSVFIRCCHLHLAFVAEQAGLEPAHRNPSVNGLAIRRSTCYAYCSVCAKSQRKRRYAAFALALSSGVLEMADSKGLFGNSSAICFLQSMVFGGRCRTRTGDPQLNRLPLYQLS